VAGGALIAAREPGDGDIFKQLDQLLAYPPDLCDHDGRATGTLRLNPLRAEVTCDHCGVILQVNPPSVAVRFCDTVALQQAFRRAGEVGA
jgi:hypothetical protein